MQLIILSLFFSFSSHALPSKFAIGSGIKASEINKVIEELVPVGTIYRSILELTQFQSLNGDCWRLMDGSSLVGTDLGILSGKANLPNSLVNGSFFRQAKNQADLWSVQGDAIRNITATTTLSNDSNGSLGVGPNSTAGAFYGSGSPAAYISDASGTRLGYTHLNFSASRVVPTADENRPYNISLNSFVKVNKSCNFL